MTDCHCLSCSQPQNYCYGSSKCGFCGEPFPWYEPQIHSRHYKAHYFISEGESYKKGKYHCKEPGCSDAAGCTKWSELKRHYQKHCIRAKLFPCDVPWCSRHGEGNGFPRFDKLRDHQRAMHDGKAAPGRPRRRVLAAKPETPSTAADSVPSQD